tara:strand:+ start:386 stop:595 length:210 start_codon:yes stop_codon:yes gene_type:complete
MEMPKELVIQQLEKQVKSLQYDCAELQKQNDELADRVKKLASKTPVWPKGYQPRRFTHRPPNRHSSERN